MALDPAVAQFLQGLQQQGLNEGQIGQLAQVQNDPNAWKQQYMQMTQAATPPPVQPTPQYPPQGQPPAQQGQMSPYGRPLTGQYTPQQEEQFRNDPANSQVINQIRQAAMQRYGTQNDAMVLGLANKVQNEGYPIDVVMEMLRSGYMLNNPDLQHVADLVGLQYDSQQSALDRALQQAQSAYGLETRTNQLFGQYADQGVQSIYNDLNQLLNQGVGDLRGTYQDATGDIGGYYDAANQATQQAGSDVLNQLADISGKLGIQDALPDVNSKIAGDLVRYAAEGQQGKAGSLANIGTLGAGQVGLAQRGVAGAAREGAQARTDLINKVLGMQNQATQGWNQERGDIMAQLSDLSRNRGSALRTGLTDYLSQKNKDALEAEIQRGTLGIQQGELDLQRYETMQNLEIEKQKLQASIAANNDPVAKAIDMTKLQKLQSEIDKNYAQIGKIQGGTGAGDTGYVSGYPALQQWYQNPNMAWGPKGAGPEFIKGVNTLIDASMAQYNKAKGQGFQADPWAISQENAKVIAAQLGLNIDLLRSAIDIYFGKSKYVQ